MVNHAVKPPHKLSRGATLERLSDPNRKQTQRCMMVNPSYYHTLYLDCTDYKPGMQTGQVEPVPATKRKPDGGGSDQPLAKKKKPKVCEVPKPKVSAWDQYAATHHDSQSSMDSISTTRCRQVTTAYGSNATSPDARKSVWNSVRVQFHLCGSGSGKNRTWFLL